MKIMLICNTDGAMYVFRKPILKSLVDSGHRVVSVTPTGTFIPKIESMGAKVSLCNLHRHSVSPGANLRFALQLFRLIKDESPDIVHSFTHKPAIFGTFAAWFAGVPKIFITVTGLGTLFIGEGIGKRILKNLLLFQYRIASSLATGIFFQNPDDLQYYVSRRIVQNDKAIGTSGSGIDLQEFYLPKYEEIKQSRSMIRQELSVSVDEKIIVLFVARAVREKGTLEFYEAAKEINKSGEHYIFIHIGLVDSDSQSVIYMGNINDHMMGCGVHYLGFKENVNRYLAAADIVCLPSYREGVPRSLIEALAFGKCIVTTDVPGCRETVRDGWNGYLCRPGDAQSLVEAILKVSRDMIDACRQRSRSYCEEKFDAELLVDITFQRYFNQE